jgi:hypothetical protein
LEIIKKASTLNGVIKRELWYDFYIVKLDEQQICVRGTLDATYGFCLEIVFRNVLYVEAPMQWKTNTKLDPVFSIMQDANLSAQQRRRFFNDGSGFVFSFTTDLFDSVEPCYIVAGDFSYLRASDEAGWLWTDSPLAAK